jgi:hypothetical protein
LGWGARAGGRRVGEGERKREREREREKEKEKEEEEGTVDLLERSLHFSYGGH